MKDEQVSGAKYERIINLPHHVSDRYPQMPRSKRAAQFSPFAALTGYDEYLLRAEKEIEDSFDVGKI